MEKVIVTAMNSKYVDYAKVMLYSFFKNAPSEKLMIFLLGFCVDLEKLNPNATIVRYRAVKDDSRASHIRGEILTQCLKDNYEKVAWFDPDIIIRNPLDDFWADVNPGVLKVMCRLSQKKYYHRFQDGIYGIGNSVYTGKLIAWMYEKLKSNSEWYSDQLYLYKGYCKYKKNIKLINLNEKYNDNTFEDSSIIWHCRLKNKNGNKKFNSEFNHYLAEANRLLSEAST